MACTANFLLEVEDIVPHRFIQARPGFEANGVEVQMHVDVRMRQKAGTQTTKMKSAKSFVEVHLQKCIPSKYTCYTVGTAVYQYTVGGLRCGLSIRSSGIRGDPTRVPRLG